jgi:multidrug efflux pump
LFLTPVFYVLLRRLSGNRPLKQHGHETAVSHDSGIAEPV